MNIAAAGLRDSGAPWWRRPGWWLALAVILYGGGYLLWYLQTPLGRAPQLDGKENLALAAEIAGGTLPHEPFYRAMLYPAALALPLALGVPPAALPALAATFGLLCHFAVALALARLAAQLWAGPSARWAALLAGGLWGLNPVALFYAVDVLDTVPSLALMAWGLVFWAPSYAKASEGKPSKPLEGKPSKPLVANDAHSEASVAKGVRDSVIGGLLMGLAVVARPHFLPLVVIAPLARAWLAGRWRVTRPDFFAWAGAAVPLLVVGCGQWAWSGQFRVQPWQGAYNFYAANRPGANGRYYTQQIFFMVLAPDENPARAESEILYARATGKQPPYSIAEMEAYWNHQAWSAIAGHPVAWLKLMVRKTYYLLNTFDQYNNKTYLWQILQAPWYYWDTPLGWTAWGMIFLLAAFVTPCEWICAGAQGNQARRARLAGIWLVFLAYGAGVLIYYASGRFRLPLMALLCVPAGGLATLRSYRREDRARGIWPGILAMVVAIAISCTNFFNARDYSTQIQDDLLEANAAAEVGDDAGAYGLAWEVAHINPARIDARRIAVVSFFNLSLGGDPEYDSAAAWKNIRPLLDGLDLQDPVLALVAGVAQWKTGDFAAAEKIWALGAAHFGPDSMPARALLAAHYLRHEGSAGGPSADVEPIAQLQNLIQYLQRTPAAK